MTGAIKLDIDSLLTTVASLKTASTSIDSALRALDDKSALLRGDWTGAASDAYTAAHAKWTGEVHAMNAVLTKIITALTTAHDTYEATETLNRDRWK